MALAARTSSRGFPEFPKNRRKVPHPMPKFWRVPLPGQQSNPESPQDIYRFLDSRTVFWSNGTPRIPFQTEVEVLELNSGVLENKSRMAG